MEGGEGGILQGRRGWTMQEAWGAGRSLRISRQEVSLATGLDTCGTGARCP